MSARLSISVVIPTYRREEVLLDTLRALFDQSPCADEILVVDQTEKHDPVTNAQLADWDATGRIRWIRKSVPSITAAMNTGLVEAKNPVVLFLDDDIIPAAGLIGSHADSYADPGISGVVGQVLQPGQEPVDATLQSRGSGIRKDLQFPFNSRQATEVCNCMAGNLSVRREHALRAGGIDENFRGVAYRFETEFCRRLSRLCGRLIYQPPAALRHLQASSGGTRAYGNPLTSASPAHSVGDYYFAFVNGASVPETLSYVMHRMYRSVRTRFHVTHPWWIPVKLVGEIRGLAWAMQLRLAGQKLLGQMPVDKKEIGVGNGRN